MFAAARARVKGRASFAAPSAALASIAVAVVARGNDDGETTTAVPGSNDAVPSLHAWHGWSSLRGKTDARIASNAGRALAPPRSWHETQTCACESLVTADHLNRPQALHRLGETSTKASLEQKYKIKWDEPLGEGGYGAVYLCTDRATGEKLALKLIPKEYTDQEAFQKEIDALLRVRASGSHPNICRLKENFDQKGNFYLVMDLISGGEMFDHLANSGPYSEADAAHLVRETASAIAFLHGVGLVHADLKPENLMLSTRDRTSSVIKVVDFGCSEFCHCKDEADSKKTRDNTITTAAYCPPEAFAKSEGARNPSFDMWSLGCIIYIMLTGRHPFDINGGSSDAKMERRIKNESPPLRHTPYTEHLSASAIDLIDKLLDKRPEKRMTAMEMLEHPWVQGHTASRDKMADSDKRLQGYKKFKSSLEVKVFGDWVSGATSLAAKETSLMERAYRSLDTDKKGYVTKKDFARSFTPRGETPADTGDAKDGPVSFWKRITGGDEKPADGEDDQDGPLSLAGFEALISDHMVNKYYTKDHVIFEEGISGDSIYFINSGEVEVATKAGFSTTLSQGALFGEGALLHNENSRNATIRCLTPVHVIRISKEYFLKYMSGGGSDTSVTVGEQDRSRNRDRALQLLRRQENLTERTFSRGEALLSCGEEGKSLYIVKSGEIELQGDTGRRIRNVAAGSIVGEHSLISGQLRNTTAVCASDKCVAREMTARDFFVLYNSSPSMKRSLNEISFRRDFQNAFAKKFGKDFSSNLEDLRKEFDSVGIGNTGEITPEEFKVLLKLVYPSLSDDDPLFYEAFQALDIDGSDSIEWEEFKKIFLED